MRSVRGLLLALMGLALMAPASADEMWGSDFNAALKQAAKEGKPVLVKFTSTWCGTCTEMAKTTLKDASVKEAMKGFVRVALDVDKAPVVTKQFRIAGLPTLLMLSPSGIIVDRTEQYVEADPLKKKLAVVNGKASKLEETARALRVKAEKAPAPASVEELARFYEKRGNLKLAAEVHLGAFKNPKMGSGPRQKAGCKAVNNYLLIEQFDRAIKLAEQVAAVDSKDPLAAHALFLKAYAQQTAGREKAALATYEKVARDYAFTKAGKLSRHYADAIKRKTK